MTAEEHIGAVADRVVESARPRQEVAVGGNQSEATAIISVIERAALNPAVDMDKMERLLQMQERIFERQAKIEFTTAMAAAQSEMEPVVRDAKNSHTRSSYARIEAIAKAINPIIGRHGFASSFDQGESPRDGHIRILGELSHDGGHTKNYHLDVPIDAAGSQGKVNKNPTQAFGSTLTYGRRYLKLMMFDIATEDDDGNAAGGSDEISDDQLSELQDLIDETGADIAAFCKWLNVDALKHLPANRFDDAKRALEKKATKTRSIVDA